MTAISPAFLWDIPSLLETPRMDPAPEVVVEGVRSLYFEGPSYQGRATRVFAFYGAPAGAEHGKCPAIVLVHGGAGSALSDWVKLWNSRGYAAIAFDHEGHLPIGTHGAWQNNPDGGPQGMGECHGAETPAADQWMFHAVANTLLAHSLLRSFPEVDPERIGITGISWGAVVASIAAAMDERLKFAALVYGCGFISHDFDDGSQFVGQSASPEHRALWRKWWDPANYLSRVKIPTLWVTGTNDFAFTLRALQLSYRETKGPRTLSLRVNMVHGHDGPGESPLEIRAFADSLVNAGVPLLKITRLGCEATEIWAEYESDVPLRAAELVFTRDSGLWQERKWETLSAQVTPSQKRVSAEIPAGTTTCFINLIDEHDLLVSSEHIIRLPPESMLEDQR